jgi:hypothetical protein
MLSLVAFVASDITLSRTVSSVNPTYIQDGLQVVVDTAGACTSSDKYGSNDCDFKWGTAYSGHALIKEAADVTGGSFSADMKVERIIPFKFTCPLCGGDCSIKIPVVGKTISFTMPDCPLHALVLDNSTTITLPADPGIPAAGVKGSLSAVDASGATIASGDIDVALKTASSVEDKVELTEAERHYRIGQTVAWVVKMLIGQAPKNMRVF